jgi:hypothetical protein
MDEPRRAAHCRPAKANGILSDSSSDSAGGLRGFAGTYDSFRISNLLICVVPVPFSNPSLSASY